MKQTSQSIKENIMLTEMKIQTYIENNMCPVVINKLKSELDQLYLDLVTVVEEERNEVS